MRPLVVLVLAPILALGLVVSAGVLVPEDPSTQAKPQSIVWAGRVFTTKAAFARWLERHDRSYEEWVRLHPSATWFHKEPPVLATKPAKPAKVKAAEVDRHFARIFVAAALGLLALVLAGAVIRSGRGALPGLRRASARRSPLGPAPARALDEATRSTLAAPARAATIALPNGTYPLARPRRGGGNVIPIYVPPERDAEPAVVRPAASHEAPVLEFRSAFVAEPVPVADLEPSYETEIEPELLVVSEPAVVSWPEAAREPEPRPERERAPEPEPAPEPEQDVSAKEEAPADPAATQPARPVVHPPARHPPHPPPVVHPKPVVRTKPPATAKPPVAAPAPVVEAPAASAPPVEEPAAPAPPTLDEQVEPEHETAAPDEALICEIGIWQGYLKSQFFASAVGPDGQEYAVAQSERFRSKNPLVRDDAAAAAHAQLTQELVELGWKPDGHGPEWWALRFRLDDARDS